MQKPKKDEEDFGIPFPTRLKIYENYCILEKCISLTARACKLGDKKVAKYIRSKGWTRDAVSGSRKKTHPWRIQARAGAMEKDAKAKGLIHN